MISNNQIVGSIIGYGSVVDFATQTPKTVTLTCQRSEKGAFCFYAYVKNEATGIQECAGYMENFWMRTLANGHYGSEKQPLGVSEDREIASYGPGTTPNQHLSKVVVDTINAYANKKYGGIGSVLMEAGVALSHHLGCDGRLMLEAVGSPHIFYHKLGLVAVNNDLNKRIVSIAQMHAQKVNTKEVGDVWMYLPQNRLDQKRIQKIELDFSCLKTVTQPLPIKKIEDFFLNVIKFFNK